MMSETKNLSNESGEPILKEIDWARITPFPSLRLFELENLAEKWTERAFNYAVCIGKSLQSAILQYPPKSKGKMRNINVAKPKNVTGIRSSFFVTTKDLKSKKKFAENGDYKKLSSNHIFLTAAWFRLVTSPPWLKREGKKAEKMLEDVRHHIVIAAMLPPYICITSTHQPMHTFISGFLEAGQLDSICLPEPALPVKDTVIEDAFVKDEAYRIWLSGLHRSVVTKADKKTFAGKDLRYALDPYDEQSFAYSAIISRLNGLEKDKKSPPVGYSRKTQTVWMSKSKGIAEFYKLISLFREMLTHADPSREGIPDDEKKKIKAARFGLNYLSKPISASAIADADHPFEINLELDEPTPDGYRLNIDEEEWHAHGCLELAKGDSLSPWPAFEKTGDCMKLSVKARFNSIIVCRFLLEVSRSVEAGLTVNIPRMMSEDINKGFQSYDLFERLIQKKGLDRAFTIRFESGHVLHGNHLYKPEYQDVLYKEFKPVKLKKFSGRYFDPSKEKPDDWNKLSCERRRRKVKTGDSLFARVVCDPRGLFQPQTDEWYLLCHDQANEVADFIFIEPERRRIELVHVKGAESNSIHRKISIDAFQVVCQQAIKNLRHLEGKNLYQRFKGYIEGNQPPREAGVFLVSSSNPGDVDIDCSGFVRGLGQLNKGLPVIRKKVVVFQPHIRKLFWEDVIKKFEEAKNPEDDSTLRPAFMLSTILIETEIACRKLGVGFEVWCEDDGKGKKKATES